MELAKKSMFNACRVKNIKEEPLAQCEKYILPSLCIKIVLIKHYVKAMNEGLE